VVPRRYEAIVPDYVPFSPEDAVKWSGGAEIAGGIAVVPTSTRRVAGPWIVARLIAVVPANADMAVRAEEIRGVHLDRLLRACARSAPCGSRPPPRRRDGGPT